ncbi:dipeptidyl-peptidase III KNAG_0K01190 [Huiozyma naganishii CBS 8797]|uniref:Dipeptidyl peptidase 3 n=1 Tax=Huiozyma naganishii (strain ATCC MYA-139 / BCRC 22969 / CBS 8797 / KCTC 17520 / NBRC 10181 / NCYC 3082 / Yp74L-3) TaxID=1071383 RepID=J7SA78_HUIN7|nr:hypothetical protein KNAG_0K01190 [Kazachstania naganishii CBS 8797]CCK72484.1 hypothetical protein KNAG_0K01190 [Kazachstania naganishii CBS 8797]
MSQYWADHDAPLTMLSLLGSKEEKGGFFNQLTDREQRYAHYMSRASHAGSRIVLRQVSPESEPIFDLILLIHKGLRGVYPESEAVKLYLEYVSQFLSNLGNYKSFGDSKFIPRCSEDTWFELLKSAGIDLMGKITTAHTDNGAAFQNWQDLIRRGIYKVDEDIALLGFPSLGHVSAYYVGDSPVSPEDMQLLKNELYAKNDILPENTRIKKLNDTSFVILVASANKENEIPEEYPPQGFTIAGGKYTVSFQFGDHSRELSSVVKYLESAREHVANDTQEQMLTLYIKHFQTGSAKAHKQAQRLWVKDISPTVETNIGFIETYREPSGIIGEFESLVAVQNKERTQKFSTLVKEAKNFINLLPWSADYEKPKFHAPDFTSLEVLTFTGSGIPAGINIPNYDDVRLNVGFKNVSLGNILSASAASSSKHPPSFIREEDRSVFEKYQSQSFEVQVGIHELLGHGTGKLLSEIAEGQFNFDIESPPVGVDGKTPVTSYYKLGETWGSKFGSLAGAFEETRAEVVAMYLITNRDLLKIFGFESKEDQDNIVYSGYLQMARAGLMALEYWDPKSGKWGQPHMQARYSIMKTFLHHSGDSGFLQIEPTADGNDLRVVLNRDLITAAGHECVRDYLHHLHVYKCSGDVEAGSQYYVDRSTVTPELAAYRDLVISKRLPRRQFVQANTSQKDGTVTVHEYAETSQGMLESFAQRDC